MAWITETHIVTPKEILDADENLDVRTFLAAVSQGKAFRWRGDYHRAKIFLTSVDKWISKKSKKNESTKDMREAFHKYRQSQSYRARTLSRLLIQIEKDLTLDLPRAPDVKEVIESSLDKVPTETFDLSLRELLGMIGAHEWRKKGIEIPALKDRIYSHYGVFAPVRGEYLDLVLKAPLPARLKLAFDIGTGTGVLAAILAKRGFEKVVATDSESRAISCANENIQRLGLNNKVEIQKVNLFPAGEADLIVCNPPWLPARPTSRMENAVYDFENQMLKAFLSGVARHLTSDGEVWLIISNLAELLGLRENDELTNLFIKSGLKVIERLDSKPRHPKSLDREDPLYKARSQEITNLWRLEADKT